MDKQAKDIKSLKVYIALMLVLNVILLFGLFQLNTKLKLITAPEAMPWKEGIVWTI